MPEVTCFLVNSILWQTLLYQGIHLHSALWAWRAWPFTSTDQLAKSDVFASHCFWWEDWRYSLFAAKTCISERVWLLWPFEWFELWHHPLVPSVSDKWLPSVFPNTIMAYCVGCANCLFPGVSQFWAGSISTQRLCVQYWYVWPRSGTYCRFQFLWENCPEPVQQHSCVFLPSPWTDDIQVTQLRKQTTVIRYKATWSIPRQTVSRPKWHLRQFAYPKLSL